MAVSSSCFQLKKKERPIETAIFSLTNKQASDVLKNILNDNQKYSTTLEKSITLRHFKLHETIVSFFEKYSFIEQKFGEARVNSSEISYSMYYPEYIKIATDSDFTELIVMENCPEVHEIDGSNHDFEEIPFPSIHHWLLYSSIVIHPELYQFINQN